MELAWLLSLLLSSLFEALSSCANVALGDLKKLIGGDKEVEEHKAKGFETQYKKVIDAVKMAGNGEVKVFRVELEGTRAEYYVVSVDKDGGKIVGLKALSVES